MKALFADTGYWIALLDPQDDLHNKAVEVTRRLHGRQIVTSEMVLTEFLNECSGRGPYQRAGAALFAANIETRGAVRIIHQTHALYVAALDLYTRRSDKEWSLTDCASMVICQEEGITETLAHDHHFLQAGFLALLRDDDGTHR